MDRRVKGIIIKKLGSKVLLTVFQSRGIPNHFSPCCPSHSLSFALPHRGSCRTTATEDMIRTKKKRKPRTKSRRRGVVRPRSEIGIGANLFQRHDRLAEDYDRNRSNPDHPTYYQILFSYLPDPSRPGGYLCNLIDRHKWVSRPSIANHTIRPTCLTSTLTIGTQRIMVFDLVDFAVVCLEEFNSRKFASDEEFGAHVLDKYHLPGVALDYQWVPDELQYLLTGENQDENVNKDNYNEHDRNKENAVLSANMTHDNERCDGGRKE